MQTKWLPNAIIIGTVFIVMFYVIAATAQKVGPSVASVSNKMSVVIPVVFAFFLYKDNISFQKLTGIGLALIGVYMASKKSSKLNIDKKYLYLPLILFIGNGLLDTYIKFTQEHYVSKDQLTLFLPFLFGTSAVLGMIAVLFKMIKEKPVISGYTLAGGIVLGIVNYGSIYFLMRTLEMPQMESSIIFPVNNMGIVALTTIASTIIFSEKLSRKNWIGVVVSILAIGIIAFS